MPNSSWMISILLFVAVLGCQISAVGSSILSPFWELQSPMCYMVSDRIDNPGGYERAVQRYRASFTRASTPMIRRPDHPFLPSQTLEALEPIEWVAIKQYGWDDDETTLLFRADNMYFVGFANKIGTWFSFLGFHHLIPGSIPLNIPTDYKGLAGGWDQLDKVPLGGDSLGLAVRNFSSFDESTSNMPHAHISAAQVIVMFPEAVRFFPIRKKIIDGWETGVSLDKPEERQLLVSWRDISQALQIWDTSQEWSNNRIRTLVVEEYTIKNEEDALRVVDVLVNPRSNDSKKKKKKKGGIP